MSIKLELERLASDIVKSVLSDRDTSLQEKMDAMKVLTSYYSALHKGGSKPDDADDETFDDLRNGVSQQEVSNGASVRDRQG